MSSVVGCQKRNGMKVKRTKDKNEEFMANKAKREGNYKNIIKKIIKKTNCLRVEISKTSTFIKVGGARSKVFVQLRKSYIRRSRSCFRMSRKCFRISSRCLRVL